MINGDTGVADLLVAACATARPLDLAAQLVAACVRADPARVELLLTADPGLAHGVDVTLESLLEGCSSPGGGNTWAEQLVAEVGEVGADGRHRGFLLVGLVDAEAGEDVQGVLPVCAGLLTVASGVL